MRHRRTAGFNPGRCPLWVIFVRSTRFQRSRHVRFASNSDQIGASQRTVAKFIKARLIDLGGSVSASSPAAFGKFIADDVEKWAKVVKFADVKTE
jgi:hypothetical protein